MKYDDKPSIDIERTRNFVAELSNEIANSDIKTDHDMLGLIIERVSEYFTKLGKTNVEEEWIPKSGQYPRSDNMNKIMASIVKDIYELFAEQSQLGLELSKVENFTETQRAIIDNLRNILKTKIIDSEVSSISNEANEYWVTDTFNSDKKINFDTGKTTSRDMLDTNEGVITLKKINNVPISLDAAQWKLNMNETSLTLSNGKQESIRLAKDMAPESLNLYGGQRYGLELLTPDDPNGNIITPGEPWTDSPLATLDNMLTGITSEGFEDDLRSEYEMIFGELPRVPITENYIKQHILKAFKTTYSPKIESHLIRKKGISSGPKYLGWKVKNVKMVANLLLELETPEPITKVHTYRSVNEHTGLGPVLITGITIYDEGVEPISEEDLYVTEKPEVTKTFTSQTPAKYLNIKCVRSTQNLDNVYLPYTVRILPMTAMVSSGTVTIMYKKFVIEDASSPKTVYYRKKDKKTTIEGKGVYQRK